MKNRKIFYQLLILLLTTFSFILTDTVKSNPKFQFSVDYTLFRYNNSYILELYCSFYQKGLKYNFSEGMFEAAGLLDVSIINKKNNEVFYSVLNKIPSKAKDTSGSVLEQRIVVQKNIPIIAGEYLMKIIGKDFNDSVNCDTNSSYEIIITENNNAPQISGVELSSSILKSDDKESSFYKYGLEVIPNPTILFGNKMNSIYYYYEIYNFTQELISDAFTIKTQIENNNREVVNKKEKKLNKVSELMIDYDSYKIDSLPTGSYFLVVSVKDSSKSINLSIEKKFYIFNSQIQGNISQSDDADFLKSEYVTMKEEQIKDEYEKIVYIRTSAETVSFEKLSALDDKRKFLYNFWKTRDTDILTTVNEFKIEYAKRISEANSLFKQNFLEGWKSDRGRIYIIYGKPNDIERFPFESETKSYEIWHYDEMEGGVICVFVELQQTGSGNYTLLHSTLRNELRNDNWKEIIKK